MSNTYAHRPHWVRFTDPHITYETHDHRDSTCDLPTRAEWVTALRSGGPVTRCRWELDPYRTGPTCGCHLCTNHVERRADRRRDRHRTREALRRRDTDRL